MSAYDESQVNKTGWEGIEARSYQDNRPWWVLHHRSPRTGLTYVRPIWHPFHLVILWHRFYFWTLVKRGY